MFVLDTNVISELRKARSGKADPNVLAWAAAVPANLQYVSSITLYELRLGILLKSARDPEQGRTLNDWLDSQVRPSFAGRILSVDEEVALECARLHVPDPRSVRDSFIAATAIVHGMTVATRNVGDFAPTGAKTVDPWGGKPVAT